MPPSSEAAPQRAPGIWIGHPLPPALPAAVHRPPCLVHSFSAVGPPPPVAPGPRVPASNVPESTGGKSCFDSHANAMANEATEEQAKATRSLCLIGRQNTPARGFRPRQDRAPLFIIGNLRPP